MSLIWPCFRISCHVARDLQEYWLGNKKKFRPYLFRRLKKKLFQTTFNNTTAYNLVTWSSIKSLNEILGLETTPEWYRPSIVISNDKGEPYEEEKWRKRLRLDYFYFELLFAKNYTLERSIF